MKKLFTLILFIAWAFNANGQIVPTQIFPGEGYDSLTMDSLNRCLGCLIKIEGTDALGNKDTITIGANRNATLGVDNTLGERNYLGIPFKPMDMRLIQRDSICWGRLTTGTPQTSNRSQNFLYYQSDLDLKKDIRPYLWVAIPQGGDRLLGGATRFTLKITTANYPVTLKCIDLTGFNYPINYNRIVNYPIKSCKAPSVNIIPQGIFGVNTSVRIDTITDWYALIPGFEVTKTKQKFKGRTFDLSVYPIPASDKLQITGLRSATSVSITSLTGKEIKNVLVNPESPEVNIEDLEKGIYILNCQSKEGVQALRIVKQ